jgi:hypothetical protein
MAILLILLLTALVVGCFVALVRWPRWFAYCSVQTKMWRLRDEFADSLIYKEVPRDYPAARQLLHNMDWALVEAKRRSFSGVYFLDRVTPDVETEPPMFPKTRVDINLDQFEKLCLVGQEFQTLRAEAALVGSWLGLAAVTKELPAALFAGKVRSAPRMALAETQLGKRLQKWLSRSWDFELACFASYSSGLGPE